VLSDAGLENQADGCDLVLRFGLPNDPGMIARKIAMTTRVLCAAPSYLTNHGTPHSPDDCLRHSCLRLARRHYLDDLWRFKREAASLKYAYQASFPAETVPFCTSGRLTSTTQTTINVVDALRGQQEQLKRLIAQKMWISDAPKATLSEMDFFDFVSGRREPPEGIGAGLVYSRFNHPDSEIGGQALCLRAH
jgi:DNA-binding transcriptional LysR family regulator